MRQQPTVNPQLSQADLYRLTEQLFQETKDCLVASYAGKDYHRYSISLSPFLFNSDSPSFILKKLSHGMIYGYDTETKSGYSLWSVADMSGVSLGKYQVMNIKGENPSKSNWRNVSLYHRYLFTHGLNLPFLKWHLEWKLVKCNRSSRERCIQIPTDGGSRYRVLNPKAETRWFSSKGYHPCIYGHRYEGFSQLVDELKLVVIASDEASVATGLAYNLSTICLSGASWSSGIDNLLASSLKALIDTDISIIIAYDCDDAGRAGAVKLKRQLMQLGYDKTRAVDLNVSNGGGLSDYCLLNSLNTVFTDLIECHDLDDTLVTE